MKKFIQIIGFVGLTGFAGVLNAALINVASVEFTTGSLKTSGKLKISEVVLTELGTGQDLALASAGAVATGSYKKTNKHNNASFTIDGKNKKKNVYRFRKSGKKDVPALSIELGSVSTIESINVFGKLSKGKKDFLSVNFLDVNGNSIYYIKNLKKALHKHKKALMLPNISGVYPGTVSAVPLPATVWLFASGIVGLAGLSGRKQ